MNEYHGSFYKVNGTFNEYYKSNKSNSRSLSLILCTNSNEDAIKLWKEYINMNYSNYDITTEDSDFEVVKLSAEQAMMERNKNSKNGLIFKSDESNETFQIPERTIRQMTQFINPWHGTILKECEYIPGSQFIDSEVNANELYLYAFFNYKGYLIFFNTSRLSKPRSNRPWKVNNESDDASSIQEALRLLAQQD